MPIVLLSSIIFGGLFGVWFPQPALAIKPLGDVFLNLIFVTIVPFIFFSIASAISKLGSEHRFGSVMFSMMRIFLITSAVAATVSLLFVMPFHLGQDVTVNLDAPAQAPVNWLSKLLSILTVSDFTKLLNHENMLPLIVFSALVGVAVSKLGSRAEAFRNFLKEGEQVFIQVFSYIMLYAPIGFFAYFAVLAATLGPKILHEYWQVTWVYYSIGLLYFVVGLTVYAWFANRGAGIKSFWRHVSTPAITALATCSGAASIPANILAAKNMGVSKEIAETVIPLGTMIHKDGSVIGGVIKIAFLFGVFHYDFSSIPVILTAIGASILVGTVMGAIPSGGLLGELLILNLYGFPTSALFAIAAISLIIDPLATLINVTTNTVCSFWIDIMYRKNRLTSDN